MSALALGEDLSPWKLCRASCSGVNSQISHQGDILAAFQLPCPSFAAGELASTHGLGPGVALRVKRSTDACLPNPCQHQGQCQVTEDRPVCSCMPGFTGEFCQGRAGNAGELSPVGPWAPEGRVNGHSALVLPLLSTPGAHPSSWFRCIPHHYNHILATCWYKTQPQAIFFFPKSLNSLAVPWCSRACYRAQLPHTLRTSTCSLAQIQ